MDIAILILLLFILAALAAILLRSFRDSTDRGEVERLKVRAEDLEDVREQLRLKTEALEALRVEKARLETTSPRILKIQNPIPMYANPTMKGNQKKRTRSTAGKAVTRTKG